MRSIVPIVLILFSMAFTVLANKKPYVANPIDTLFVNEDDSLHIDLSTCFADTDGIIVGIILNLPVEIAIHSNANIFQLIPQSNFYGTISGSAIATDDSGSKIMEDFVLVVKNINDPPRFIARIKDTSITNNSTLQIDVKSFVHDIDNPDSTLFCSIEPISGIGLTINKLSISINPVSFIDTAAIHLSVRDSAGLSDSLSFRVYTNRATRIGAPFKIFRSALGHSANNAIAMFRWTASYQLIKDSYTIYGQRACKPLKAVFQGLGSGVDIYTDCFGFGDSLTLACFRLGSDQANWHYALLDSKFDTIAAYKPPENDNIGHLSVIHNNTIVIFGRVSNYRILLADIFDLQLRKIRTDTISYNLNGGSPAYLFVNDSSINYFWTDAIASDTIYTQLFAKRFSLQTAASSSTKSLLTYIPGTLPYRLNLDAWVNVLPIPKGGYYILWNIADAERAGNQFYSFGNPSVYAIRLDDMLQPIGTYRTVLKNDGSFMRNVILTSGFMGNNIFISWKNFSGGWDNINQWRYQLFDSMFTPLTSMADDSLKSQFSRDYRIINDSILFKATDYSDSATGAFIVLKNAGPVKNSPPKIAGVRTSGTKGAVSLHRKQLLVENNGYTRLRLFSLNGREIGRFDFKDQLTVSLINCSKSIIVVKLSSIQHPNSTLFCRTLYMP